MNLLNIFNRNSDKTKLTEELSSLKDEFNSLKNSMSDPPGIWQPLAGYNYYDVLGSEGYYKSFAGACIKKRAMNLVKGKIHLFKDFKFKKNEIFDHPFLNLLNTENSYGQTFMEMLFISSINCDLRGNAYIIVNKIDFFNSALPVELVPVPAKFVVPHLNAANTLVDYYDCTVNGQRYTILPENMIRFKVPHPTSNIFGFAPVDFFNFTLDIDFLQNRTQRKFFDNFAQMGVVIETQPGTSDTTRDKLEDQIKNNRAGSENAHKGMILPAGMKVVKSMDTNREMDFVKSRLAIRDEICVILDCDKVVMNITDDVNYNNSKSALRNWIENNLAPYAKLVFAQPLTQFAKKNYDKRLIVEIDFDFETDRDMQIKTYELYRKYNLATVNEIREFEGMNMDNDPRSNDLYTPINSSNSKTPDVPVIEDIKKTEIQNN